MKLLDKLFAIIGILTVVFTTHLIAYELGQKSECRASGGRWSIEFGDCNRGDK